MADFVCNIAKGRIVELYNRVKSNDPTNAAFVLVPLDVTGDQDAAMADADTLSALLALSNVAEQSGSSWARKTITDSDLASLPSPDDGNDRFDVDMPDQTWLAVAASNDTTDLVLCYDGDTGAGDDTDIIPLCVYDFAITTDGTDVTAQVDSAGFFRAS